MNESSYNIIKTIYDFMKVSVNRVLTLEISTKKYNESYDLLRYVLGVRDCDDYKIETLKLTIDGKHVRIDVDIYSSSNGKRHISKLFNINYLRCYCLRAFPRIRRDEEYAYANSKIIKGEVNNMNNNNIIEELAFMDEKLDKILEQQSLIMKKLSIMNKDEYISTDDFDFVGETMEGWFKDVLNKLYGISGIVEREGE